MRWLAATAALVAATVALGAWIWLRDRSTSGWRGAGRALAFSDAQVLLGGISGHRCGAGCDARVVGQDGDGRWLVRLRLNGSAQCYRLDTDAFTSSVTHGVAGVEATRCT
jgi:hypothetical protein